MKQIISKSIVLAAMAGLLSFTNYGAGAFEIFLNNRVVAQQFGNAI